MKTKIGILILAICATFGNLQAQRVQTTTRAMSYDISDNLDLEAVASIFGDSKDLEDFEYRLNDPDTRISNLDLNQDGYIDYLRVVENSSDRNSLILVQAVLDQDIYQDVASIEVERVNNGNPRVQIVGNDYIYGSNYIIEPVFVRTPSIFSFFWGPRYVSWHSPYYWNYYPRWYYSYRPYSPFKYQRYVHVNINYRNTYHYSSQRNIHFSGNNYNQIRRNDYASKHPDRSFNNRNQGLSNKYELKQRRPDVSTYQQKSGTINRSSDRSVQSSPSSGSSRTDRPRTINQTRPTTTQSQSGTYQSRTRESNQVQSGSTNSTANPNVETRSRTISTPTTTRDQSTTKPIQDRTRDRIEPTNKSAVIIQEAPSQTTRTRSTSTSTPSTKTEVKTSTSKKATKVSRSEKRRTE